jgi:acyl-CoA thioester hydrolase
MTTPTPRRIATELEVRYIETDQMGRVHHAAYVAWMEVARTRWCRESGVSYAEIEAMGYFLMVAGIELRYTGAVRYGDTVRVECWVSEMASRTLRFAYEVFLGEQRVTTGSSYHVWVERSSGRTVSIPAALREPFARLAGAN